MNTLMNFALSVWHSNRIESFQSSRLCLTKMQRRRSFCLVYLHGLHLLYHLRLRRILRRVYMFYVLCTMQCNIIIQYKPKKCTFYKYYFIFMSSTYFEPLGRVAQSVRRLTTGWAVRWPNPGGGEIFCTCPDRHWGPPSLLYNGYRVFPGG
jgi:hypothetical protein